VLHGSTPNEEHFLNLVTSTVGTSENGAFAVAFHPDYVHNGRFWISRTPSDDGVVTVEEFRRSTANPDLADPTPVRTLARTPPGDGSTHNGGALAFGPDGLLYWSVGDGRSGDSRDPAYLRGKIFRLDVDAAGTGLVDLASAVWSRGLRNPWRFSFDRANGDLYIGDVGAGTEEINIQPAGDAGGRDYGWPTVDGFVCATPGCDMSGVTLPAADANGGVVIGGYVYRGRSVPCLRGWYVYTDFGAGVFSRLRWVGGAAIDHAEIQGLDPHPMVDQPTSMGEDADGELYVVNRNGGALFKIVAAP
jgi:glucose/arabinose dehydrogenase